MLVWNKYRKFYNFIINHSFELVLARKTAPGLGYGLIWNKGPLAVASTPDFASSPVAKPVDQLPL